MQFRCECDEWYKITIQELQINPETIFLSLECPLCNHKENRKIYVENLNISSEDIENLLNKYAFYNHWNDKNELIYELECLKLDIDLIMEEISKESGSKIPSEDEILERHKRHYLNNELTEGQMQIERRKEKNGFNKYISTKYDKLGRIMLCDGLSEFNILLGIKTPKEFDAEDKKFLDKYEIEELNRLDRELNIISDLVRQG